MAVAVVDGDYSSHDHVSSTTHGSDWMRDSIAEMPVLCGVLDSRSTLT